MSHFCFILDQDELGYEWDEEGDGFQFKPRGDRRYIEGRSIKCVK